MSLDTVAIRFSNFFYFSIYRSKFRLEKCSQQNKSPFNCSRRLMSTERDIQAIESLLSQIPQEKSLAAQVLTAAEIDNDIALKFQSHAAEILELARSKLQKRANYINLATTLTFFLLYSYTMMLQSTSSFEIESRCVAPASLHDSARLCERATPNGCLP